MIDRVLLDLDGVLVKFVEGACKFHGKTYQTTDLTEPMPWNLEPLWGMTGAQLWEPLGYEFWANLEPYEHMHEFVDALEAKFGTDNICLLTSPVRTAGAIEGKIDWIRKHLPQYRRRFLVGPKKQFCASPHHLLVDDNEDNERSFKEAGGHTFLVPAAWNRRFREHPLEALKTWLSALDALHH